MHITVPIILTVLGAIASSVLYRMGGAAGYETKYRDFGVPFVACLVMWAWGWGHWTLVLSFGLLFGACTTYFGFVNKWFNKPKATKYWWNWMLCGIVFGLSAFPTCWAFGLWWGLLWRTFFLAVTISAWSSLISNPVWEENGRGALIVASIPILLIH